MFSKNKISSGFRELLNLSVENKIHQSMSHIISRASKIAYLKIWQANFEVN